MARSRQALLVWLVAGVSAFAALAIALGPDPCGRPDWAGMVWLIILLLAGLTTTVAIVLTASRSRAAVVIGALLAGGGVIVLIFMIMTANWAGNCTS